jgi:glycosyltransferase involved in cell wall biosynthesis
MDSSDIWVKHISGNNMKRIAIYLPSLSGGGTERVMVTIANALASEGYFIDLLLAKAYGPYLKEVSPKIHIVNCNASRVLTSLPVVVRFLRNKRPATLLAAPRHANIVALLASRLAYVPTRIVVTEHVSLMQDTKYNPNLRSHFLPLLMRWTYPWADKIVAVSKGIADELILALGLPQERVQIIYNPVVTPDLLKKAEEPVNDPWLQPGRPPVILAVGRLAVQKDYPTLLKAFALVRAQRPAYLLILGEGPERPFLEALARRLGIAEDVRMPGFVENPYPYMRRASVLVLSSLFEGLPTVLIEAMACGLSVVSTDCPSGPREILEDGKYGYLVPVGDPYALAEAIVQTISTPMNEEILKIRALDFSVSKAIADYVKIIDGEVG